jgi:prephenate dehydrogenase
MDFPHVTILGSGLLGGSLALALQKQSNGPHVQLWARRPETAEKALSLGIPGATSDLSAAVRDSHLVVLAVPVGTMPELLTAAIQAGLPETCLITDVGSVKGTPHLSIREIIHGSKRQFIGSHPMAGSEQGGIDFSSSELFKNAACLLTNDEQAPASLCTAIESFWQSVGCQTTWMNAAAHDTLVARISHLPHIIAAAAARTCLESSQDGKFGGGGLRDTTRVAAGNPEMWAEILTENNQALLTPLRQTITDLTQLLALIESADQEATRQWLITAKDRRDSLPTTR